MLQAAKDYLVNWESTGDMIPNVAGMACELGVCERTIYNWAEEHEEFLQITRGMMTAQQRRLLSGGLSGQLNANITKLILGKHGYSDRLQSETEHKGTVEVIATQYDADI